MEDFEQLGAFYLGRRVDDGQGAVEPVLYDANGLTTHAICVGMTGSGKTGLSVDLRDELRDLEHEAEEALAELRDTPLEAPEIEVREVRLRKADLDVQNLALVWIPWRMGADGVARPAWRSERGAG